MIETFQGIAKVFEQDGFKVVNLQGWVLVLERNDNLTFSVKLTKDKFNFYLHDVREAINVSSSKSIEKIYADVNKRLIAPNESKWQEYLNKTKEDEERELNKKEVKNKLLSLLETTCYKDSYEFSKMIDNKLLVRVRIGGLDSIKLELDFLPVELAEKIIMLVKENKND